MGENSHRASHGRGNINGEAIRLPNPWRRRRFLGQDLGGWEGRCRGEPRPFYPTGPAIDPVNDPPVATDDDSYRTDEDMFKVIPQGGYTIRVGFTSTAAKYNVRSFEDVRGLLKALK